MKLDTLYPLFFFLQKTNGVKIKELGSQLSNLAASEHRKSNIEKQLLQKENELKDFKADNNVEKLQEEIKSLLRDKKEKESDLVKLKEEEDIMIQQSEAQTKITMMENDRASKKDQYEGM